MFAKLAAVILTIGAVAATLLAARQQRLYAVHESVEAMRRIAEHDRTLWRLRGEIAARVTPGKVRQLADDFGPLAYLHDPRPAIEVADQEGMIRRAANAPIGSDETDSVEEPDVPAPDEAVAPVAKEQDA